MKNNMIAAEVLNEVLLQLFLKCRMEVFMTYTEAREFIDNSNQYGSKLGLTTVTELLRRLDNPQNMLKVIHIAGTNGKGSTTAYISSILTAEGYRTGRYTSPAVFTYRERIQIGSDYISEQGVSAAIDAIKPACEAMVRDGFEHPTTFEIETAMAYLYFAREKVDFAVIEVGLGGRLDATNVISHPLVSVLTSISMDHMQYLGNSLTQITREKAGIIKQGSPVITGNKNPEVIGVIKQVCLDNDSELIEVSDHVKNVQISPEGTKFIYEEQELEIHLLGEYQLWNAFLAVQTVKTLQKLWFKVSNSSIKTGLEKTSWSGRLEVLAKNPYFIIDGAHNEDAALQLRRSLMELFPDRRKIFIMGVLADKDYKKILEITVPLADVIITLTPDNSRALASSILAKEALAYTKTAPAKAEAACIQTQVIDAGGIQSALRTAYTNAGEEDIILAFGSLSYLGELKGCWSEHWKQTE
jgi:dihydrofolate synthase/folylpolyglutamate synthase